MDTVLELFVGFREIDIDVVFLSLLVTLWDVVLLFETFLEGVEPFGFNSLKYGTVFMVKSIGKLFHVFFDKLGHLFDDRSGWIH